MSQLPRALPYFDEVYRDYERQNPTKKLDHYVDAILSVAPRRAGHLLDIGCGLGAFLARAAERLPSWELSGTDIDPEAVSATSVRVPGATVVRASAVERPFPRNFSFDAVTAWDVIEHVDDLDTVRSTVLSQLNPGGVFLFVVPVYDGPTGPFVRALDRDPTHLHKKARGFWLDWARTSFEIVEWHGIFRYLVGHHHIHLATATLRAVSPAIMVTCRVLPEST